jgi:hypothetical protein
MNKSFYNYLFLSFFILILYFLGEAAGTIGVILASFIFYKIIFDKRYDLIPLILIIFYPVFCLVDYGSDYFSFQLIHNQYGEENRYIFVLPPAYTYINFGSFSISISIIFGLLTTIKNLYNFANKQLFLKKWLSIAYIIAAFPVVIGFIISFLDERNRMLAGIIIYTKISILLWAYQVCISEKETIQKFLDDFCNKYIVIYSILCLAGLVYNHIIFNLLSISAGIGIYFFYKKQFIYSILIFFSIFYTSYNSSLTIAALPILGFILFILLKNFNAGKLVLILGIIIHVYGFFYILNTKVALEKYGNTTVKERIMTKAFGDRLYPWKGALEQIYTSNPFIVPSGRTFEMVTYSDVEKDWEFGAHNLYLEVFRQVGLFSGLIIILIIVYFLLKLNKLWKKRNLQYIVIIAGLYSTFLVYGFTGHAIVGHDASIIFYVLTGFLAGLTESIP